MPGDPHALARVGTVLIGLPVRQAIAQLALRCVEIARSFEEPSWVSLPVLNNLGN